MFIGYIMLYMYKVHGATTSRYLVFRYKSDDSRFPQEMRLPACLNALLPG